MSSPIRLRPDELRMVRSILATYLPGVQVLAFGSRVTGNEKPMSDLDLCVVDDPPIPPIDQSRVSEAFSGSPLPFKVDVAYWSEVSPRFRSVIQRTSVKLD